VCSFPDRRAIAQRAALVALVASALVAVPRSGEAYRKGPPPGHTGGFDEPTCATCHHGDPLNEPGGVLRIEVPPTFVPGAELELEVRLARAGMRRAGFQLSARYADGGQAGELLATGAAVQLVAAHPVAYAAHTTAGSTLESAGEARWRLRWRAPAGPRGTVVFHVTANAADDDDSELGDLVYAGSAISRPRVG
jgi:hypothetical protein